MSMVESATAIPGSLLSDAARELYAAELALHDARQSGVDAWISAAADHLHHAVQSYVARLRATERTVA
ncbi:hypothetical protein FDG2_5086 [Candidatus Protofrankia californiensis]|uniref:Uncharacterized protein n=1 Tax=Candidatus Protofrankia californiensis TaxID=1839754 RepID=A0A1C3PAQ7_9ACTN|nr:hypothetical protein FDG2_5086 [Candidatus Protofrankia californiensis]